MHDWARTRLQELLQGWELETPGCSMRIVTMDSCLGDVRAQAVVAVALHTPRPLHQH